MRVFKGRLFARFARKSCIADHDLCATVKDMERGLIDADLGGGVYKQRVRRQGAGKSGGFRTIVLLKHGKISVFIFGFAKKDMQNITVQDLAEFRRFAKETFKYANEDIERLCEAGALEEICD